MENAKTSAAAPADSLPPLAYAGVALVACAVLLFDQVQCWNAEEAREKVKMTPWNFYRLRKKLKILLTPCFTEYREGLRRHRRVRGC